MAGDVSCEWAPWFRSHYRNWDRPAEDFDVVAWQVNHTKMLRELRLTLEQDDAIDRLYQERQGDFWYERASGLQLSGTPDLVAVSGERACVYDVKTGRPRNSDRLQVLIYMYCLPRCRADLAGLEFSGQLVYQNAPEVALPNHLLLERFEEHFEYFLDILDSDAEPRRIPSEAECSFCNIGPADCPDRIG